MNHAEVGRRHFRPVAVLRSNRRRCLRSLSCLVVVSTGPTALVGGNIVFVAVDGHGALVASLHITVVDLAGEWRLEADDGARRIVPV